MVPIRPAGTAQGERPVKIVVRVANESGHLRKIVRDGTGKPIHFSSWRAAREAAKHLASETAYPGRYRLTRIDT